MTPKRKDRPRGDGNRPFERLADVVEKAGMHLRATGKPPAPVLPKAMEEESEEEVFRRAMEGVTPIERRPGPDPFRRPLQQTARDPEAEELRMMQEAAEESSIPVPEHPEYIEGWIGVAGLRYISGLRNGTYSIQGQLDLHGLTRPEARAAVEEFIVRMSRFHSCCVKIIHGRGINSPGDRAVLKENLQSWLSTRRMSRRVVAYASAPVADGGVGAVYVLLRQGPRSAPGRSRNGERH